MQPQLFFQFEQGRVEAPQHSFTNLHFAIAPNDDELATIRDTKPSHVLLSYALWKNKDIQKDFVDVVGYRPQIMLDNGAYTFANKSYETRFFWDILWLYKHELEMEPESVILDMQYSMYAMDPFTVVDGEEVDSSDEWFKAEFYDYVDFVLRNKRVIDSLIAIDEMNDLEDRDVMQYAGWEVLTRSCYSKQEIATYAFQVLRDIGVPVIPVYQYGSSIADLDELVELGATYIALGGSNRLPRNNRIQWAKILIQRHPEVKFHLLGTQDRRIYNQIPGLYSADGGAWNYSASFSSNKREAAAQNVIRMQSAIASRQI